MALIKIRGWQMFLVRAIVVPTLERIALAIDKKSRTTEAEWDDVLAGAFLTVVKFLKGPEAFEET